MTSRRRPALGAPVGGWKCRRAKRLLKPPTELIKAQTGHMLATATERYKRGGNMECSRAVARLRNDYRAAANGA